MSLEKYPEILVVDNLLTREECQQAIQHMENLTANDYSKEINNRPDRQDDCIHITIACLEGFSITNNFMKRFHGPVLNEYIARFPMLAYKTLGALQCKAQRTKAGGGFHDWHYESADGQTSDRVLTYTLYLNDDFEAGETEFLYQNLRVEPVPGRCVVFPTNFLYTHRGNPPIGGTKYILTGWVLDLDPYARARG